MRREDFAEGTRGYGHVKRTFPGPALLVLLMLAGLASCGEHKSSVAEPHPEPAAPAAPEPTAPAFVRRDACVQCHAVEAALFHRSDHDLAMQPADETTVLGDFNDTRFTYTGVTSTFYRKEDAFWVQTDGPDGTLQDYRIAYTFGVEPLQQYMVEFPDGRIQVLSISWDTRPEAEGGQRWFHLYPGEPIDHEDVLHWTGPAANWNYMCAECHSTNVRKGYNADEDRFDTTWSEIDVSCEACHGPGSTHVEWASEAKSGVAPRLSHKGFSVDLNPQNDTTWSFAEGAPTAHRVADRGTSAQVPVCARCHSRRTQVSEAYRQDQPLANTHRVALLDEGLYHPDGQILDEVYVYGSFIQSRMHAASVTCTDCHDPHTAKLRASGNAVCTRCHRAAVYDTVDHSHHVTTTRCVACHMLEQPYMVIDQRADHSFRIPRPDLSETLGTPNACADCHTVQTSEWAAGAISAWKGSDYQPRPHWGTALAAGRRYEAGAGAQLSHVFEDEANPAIIRATALELLARFPDPRTAALIRQALQDKSPLVRRAALPLTMAWEPDTRVTLAWAALNDPVLTVRLEAVSALVDAAGTATLSQSQRADFTRAAAEYRAVQMYNADRAEAWLNIGALDARLGHADEAETAYTRAIDLQPSFLPSYLNLADLYRQIGRDADGEALLRRALQLESEAPDIHHALGLLLIRTDRVRQAVEHLRAATEIGPDVPRYAYVYSIALFDMGQRAEALAQLEAAHNRFTGHRGILTALMQYSAAVGDTEAAAQWADMLRSL